jgi:hypothetical protein
VIVAFLTQRELISPPKSIRSTLIASSVRALRERGRLDDYARLLDPLWRDLPMQAIAATWLPLDAGRAHYAACDALGFSVAEQVAIGRQVGDRVNATFLGTMLRAAKGVGVTPWLGLPHCRKLYERLFDGGDVCVTKTGPKDARMELAGNPLVTLSYFRQGLRGMWTAALELFCSRAYVTEAARTETSLRLRISWA